MSRLWVHSLKPIECRTKIKHPGAVNDSSHYICEFRLRWAIFVFIHFSLRSLLLECRANAISLTKKPLKYETGILYNESE